MVFHPVQFYEPVRVFAGYRSPFLTQNHEVMLKKLLFLLLFATAFFPGSAQQPVLTVNGPDSGSVKMNRLELDVIIAGNMATTTITMRFCNSSKRVLEGELSFPMPEGVSISRFALDMNGKMREAVPVEKEKGQVVFENIVRREVDPGLLEKTEGNNFRTRIYPIPANGCRTVIVAYEQELNAAGKNALQYSLPMQFKYPIKEFVAAFNVYSSAMPEVGSDCNTGMKFASLKNVFQSTVQKNNFTPNGSFQLMMPMLETGAEVMMQQVNGQYYFMVNTYPKAKIEEKKIPGALSLVWDASLSGRLRNHTKEMELLDAYFKKVGNIQVHLFTLDLGLTVAGQFTVSGGDWTALKKAIEAINYDGATNFSALRPNLPGGECLLFTDGLNTWGGMPEAGFAPIPVYPICASANADYELMRLMAAKTGGTFINLNEQTTETALTSLTQLPLQLLNVKTGGMVSEVYPSVATPVQGNCAVSGISATPQTEIILEFGYGKTVAFTQTVKLNFEQTQVQEIPLNKIWAQKKIAQLNRQYDVFKTLVTELGKKYGIVTRNTSLIVLDDVADYVQYEIEPPAELQAEYTRQMNEKQKKELQAKSKTINDALNMYKDVANWWRRDFKPVKNVVNIVDMGVNARVPAGTITGRVTNERGEPLPGASVVRKGTQNGVPTDGNGNFQLRMNTTGDIILQASYVGYHSTEIAVTQGVNSVNFILNPVSHTLEHVVVVSRNRQENDGDRVTNEPAFGYSSGNVRLDSARAASAVVEDQLRRIPGVEMDRALQGRVPGVAVNSNTGLAVGAGDRVVLRGSRNVSGDNRAYERTPPRTQARLNKKIADQKTKRKGKAGEAVVFQHDLNPDARYNGGAPPPPPPPGTSAQLTVTEESQTGNVQYLEFAAANGAYDRTGSTLYRDSLVVRTTAVPFLRIADSAGGENLEALATGGIKLLGNEAEAVYLKQMDSAATGNAYNRYQELRKDYEELPAFYFDISNWFLKKGDTATGIKILSGIADLGIEDHELFKTLGYQLKLLGWYEEEVNVFRKVLEWRPQEPQSYRDYALALADAGKYQRAVDTLYTALLKNYDRNIASLYPGIEEIIITELKNILSLQNGLRLSEQTKLDTIKAMEVDVRVVLNWNMNDTDIDLWVIDPNGEKCYYQNKLTPAGGRISNDFTRGYGPEQFMVKKALKGKYKVLLHYYGNRQQKIAGPTTVMAEIFTGYGTAKQERKLVTLFMDKDKKEGVPVAEFEF